MNGLPLAADRLDDPDLVEAGDPGGMLRQVASAAAHVRIAVRAASEAGVEALAQQGRPRAVVVAGPGTAGEALDALCGPTSPVQVLSVTGERLPGWIGAADLVIATTGGDAPASDPGADGSAASAGPDGSAAAEAVLALAEQALRRGCQVAGIGPASSPLRDLVRGPYIPAAPGFWPVLTGLLAMAEGLGIARVGAGEYEDAATVLEDLSFRCRPTSESFVNPAKSLALDLLGGLPVVWGTRPLGSVAARRFVSQLGVVGKYPAIFGALPEAAAGQAALFDGPFVPVPEPQFPSREDPEDLSLDPQGSAAAAELRLVLMADPSAEDPGLASLRGAARDLAEQRGIGVSELAAEGERPLRRLATLIHLGDYTSVYLAIACGIDPSAAAAIGDLAERVA